MNSLLKLFRFFSLITCSGFGQVTNLIQCLKIRVHYTVINSTVERALVRNKAKLAYDAVSAWIEGESDLPLAASVVQGLDKQLRVQDTVAQKLRLHRHRKGSLEFQTFQPHAIFEGERVVEIKQQEQNRARQLIEEFMIATNACTANFLAEQGSASLRRVVRSPERWMRIVEVANEYGYSLPNKPEAQALESFLAVRHKADPLRFPDLSLIIIKLMGSGEYVVEIPGEESVGHFGLAERDYTHSTAPNRRYPDLITLRMMKAILTNSPAPYGVNELEYLAAHCTRQEDAARKVERRVRKSEAALLLGPMIGHHFDSIVTGHADKGTWVRLLMPPVEGRLIRKIGKIKVGQQIKVKLVLADVERGFIDFERI
ncbi:MAG: RNB domain-containing ribonuclease [Chlorobiales bacterium]|nr:RNB domain-containing ribonuclease [Chlorobiales bacterium]